MNIRESRIDGSRAIPYTFIWKPPSAVAEFEVSLLPERTLEYKVYINYDEGYVTIHFSLLEPATGEEIWEHVDIGFRAAIQVFHTVWAIMLQFLDETEDKVDVISFTADSADESRNRFYHTISQQIADIFDVEYSFQGVPSRGENIFEIPIDWAPAV